MKRSCGYLVLKFETQTLTGLGSGPILTRWKSNVLHSVFLQKEPLSAETASFGSFCISAEMNC